jgi:hypothetical protein
VIDWRKERFPHLDGSVAAKVVDDSARSTEGEDRVVPGGSS